MTRKNLPEDVIVEILLRLPFKPLLRFRCVSKHWRSLISDPYFSKSHLNRASGQTQRLLLHTPLGLGSLEVDAPFGDGSALRELAVPIKRQDRRVSIVGSCNGLVCVGFFEDIEFYVWNPSTGDRRKLPDPGFSVPQPKNDHMRAGFGYDSSTDDYKLFVWPSASHSPPLGLEGKVFSLKKNSWKRIQSLDDRYAPYPTTGVLVNGALHWLVDLFPLEPFEFRIVALDLAEEKFREVPLPKDEDVIVSDILSNVGGRLCVNVDGPDHIELWGMLEYGVQESWAPLFTVEDSYFPLTGDLFSLFSNFWKTGDQLIRVHCCTTPLCFSRSDQLVVLGCGDELRRYNSKREIIEKTGISGPYISEAAVFVESLLSPNDFHCHGASFL